MPFEDKIEVLENAKFKPFRILPAFTPEEEEYNALLDRAIKIIQNY